MNGTVRTFLIVGAVVTWIAVHIFAAVDDFSVSSSFDTAMPTLVGAVMMSSKKHNKTPKD